jgi:hypothetical protein
MSKLIRFQPLTALTVAGIALSTLVGACSENNPLSDVQEGLCCSQFSVGADLQGADFGLEGQIDGQFKAFAQAGSDLAVVANGALLDAGVSCKAIALDLGAEVADVEAAAKEGGASGTTKLCNLAVAQIKAGFAANGTFKGTIGVDFQEPKCNASVDAQVNCEAGCTVSGECSASAELPKCKGGKPPTVQCSGSCEGSATAAVSCTGTCDAKCTGACSAKADVAVDCKGTCEGTCEADAAGGTGTGIQADGSCEGKCNGKCTFAADFEPPKCEGTCEGKCEGSCSAEAGVKIKCDGTCMGDFEAPTCEGGSAELDCDVDADCKANCDASVTAKAECTPPSVAVVFKASGTIDAAAELQLKTAIASLEANLPKLLVVVKARGDAFLAGVEASAEVGVKLVGNVGDLSGEAALCVPAIAGALADASGNFSAALNASLSVVGSVGVK